MIKSKARKLRRYLRRVFSGSSYKHQRQQTSFPSISQEIGQPDQNFTSTNNNNINPRQQLVESRVKPQNSSPSRRRNSLKRHNSVNPLGKQQYNSDAQLSINTKPEGLRKTPATTTQPFDSSTLKRTWTLKRRPPSPPSYMLVVPDPADVFIPTIKLTPAPKCINGCTAQHGYSPTDVQEMNTDLLNPYFQSKRRRNTTGRTRSNGRIQQ
ncbi:4629_t:CDS:1 [Paraglomus brasilianum]|uniref:4629_t:CDS:1 n=1 Tax=Paraglomus brasilianum TaxID=144538 RepID=A0A9N9G2F6_9GLOM|nr:4629_t:CDS:1 [Paraglomus brasilianum]